MIADWVLEKLEALKEEPILLVQDSLRLLPDADGAVHRFASDHGFTVIIAATNLVFRELFEKATVSKETKKPLVLDRAPARRKAPASWTKAPPPFYPDVLARTPATARINISLRQFLIDRTGDPDWPREADDPRFARLISRCLDGVLQAHRSLRAVHPTRFTDHDFKTIVAYAALGVPETAFKRLETRSYWRIALLGHPALAELDALAPEIAQVIRKALGAASAPFCWFADTPPERVVRAFYLAAILAQHTENWPLLLPSIDPDLRAFSRMETALIREAAPELTAMDPGRAHTDLQELEASLSTENLQFILLDQWQMAADGRFAEVLEKERYSTLIRSLALLLALDNLLSDASALAAQEKVQRVLGAEPDGRPDRFIEQRPAPAWENLKTACQLARSIRDIRHELDAAVRNLVVKPAKALSLAWFRSLWNDHRVNRLEYYLSALERQVRHGDFLPRAEKELPTPFLSALERIRARTVSWRDDAQRALAEVNARYQEWVVANYPSWLAADSSEVWLTSQFLRRCVKPHWDPQREQAVVFVFDGMRYDIWDELVRPAVEDRMEIIADYPALSLLPSETHISRKAIFAGTFPDAFDTRSGEDALLKVAMAREFGYQGEVAVVAPEGQGTGETVRYRAENMDWYIFELCDKELHKIPLKTLPDGRWAPARPLAFIYQQHIKDIIDTEVMAIIRGLAPDTKVFVVADHGFGAVGRERIRVEASWLNEPTDCCYLNAGLRQTLAAAGAPRKVRDRVLEFPVAELRMPDAAETYDRTTKQRWRKSFASFIFPRPGYALARPNAKFNPDAYSHGGVSIQEMLVPMLVMRVKAPEEGLLVLGSIRGPTEMIEGETAEFRLPVQLAPSHKNREIRLEAEAVWQNTEGVAPLPRQVQYVSAAGGEIVFRFIPDAADASDQERKAGLMARTLTISVTCRETRRLVRKTRTVQFAVRLNSEKIIRRVPAHLGKILGLTPKGLR